MQSNPKRRTVLYWSVVILSFVAIIIWRIPGAHFPELQMRILIVVFGTAAAVMNLHSAMLLGFSKQGGWGAATAPLLWAAVMLVMAFDALSGTSERWHSLSLSAVAATLAVAASVAARLHRARADAD